jgi:hypothetical protein
LITTGSVSIDTKKSDEELMALQTELQLNLIKIKEKDDEIARYKQCNIVLKGYVENVKQRLRKEIIYIASTRVYSAQNNFKVGGCGSRQSLKKRLATYNTGRPENDLYYFCYIGETPDHSKLEKRINDVIGGFRDSKEKEMYVMHFKTLEAFIKQIRTNYGEEIDQLNDFVKNVADELTTRTPFIPEPIVLNAIKVSRITNGEIVEKKIIDLDALDDAEQTELVQKMFREFEATVKPDQTVVKRQEFETFVAAAEVKFKKMPLWKRVKSLAASVKQFRLTY